MNTATCLPPKPTTESSVLLTPDQVAKLDQIAVAIRHKTGQAFSRSAMIRAIIHPVLSYYQDWFTCESEQQLRQTIANQLMRGNR